MSSLRAKLACLVALAFTVATGCGGGGSEKNPAGGALLQQAATATRAVTSLAFSLRTSGDAQVKVDSADAKLLRNGNAQGSVKVTQLGLPIQLDFVVLGKTVHLRGFTGGWQQQPLSSVAGIYDPSAVLDPDRGLVQLLTTAKNPSTKGQEKVAGQDCYRIDATLAQAPLSRLVPGISTDTPAELWISKADHRVLKADVKVPSKNAGKPGDATVTFADFNKPFSITAPAQ
ncbi:MAG: LppX_LprAFG lipoprotein [Actinoallomurus sp.]